jgi:serine/threonine protein kinase
MTPNSGRAIEVFTEAIQLPIEERVAFVDRACGGDEALRRKIEALLKSNDRAEGFLEEPISSTLKGGHRTAGEKPGDRVDRYTLLEQIGEGGCGIVFMAEQDEPVRRRVALKVIKPGMDTKSVIARFEAERQALALMDHPNIAHVFDAGATSSGRPYFVMELVEGLKITDYCDQHSLPLAARLELFTQVCDAAQHAHQKGIIHRDIKPSNILVMTGPHGKPVPKVIDFGIAKATTGQRLTDKTIFTALEMLIGTPAYMSPEQAEMSGLDIDTRSDIYSLGVLLYELLTGSTPLEKHRFKEAAWDEICRLIREEEPPKPSTRLSSSNALVNIAACRRTENVGTEHGTLARVVREVVEPTLEGARAEGFSFRGVLFIGLMLTAAGQRGDGARCRALGISVYLTKPVRRAGLRSAISAALNRQAAALLVFEVLQLVQGRDAPPRRSLHCAFARMTRDVAMLIRRGRACRVKRPSSWKEMRHSTYGPPIDDVA